METNFRVEIGRVGKTTADGTRHIKQDAVIDLREGACVLHAAGGMPEATTVVAELTELEVQDGIIWATGYGLPGVVQALKEKTLFIAFEGDSLKYDEPVSETGPLMISELFIRGGMVTTPARYSWKD